MSKSNHDAHDARAQKRDAHTMSMKHTTPSIISEIVSRASQLRQQATTPFDEFAQAAQIACARWLSGYRGSLELDVRRLVELTSISPQQLLWLDLGLADSGMLTEQQETLLRDALISGRDADRKTLSQIIDIALGYTRPHDPGMLEWIFQDLEENIWRQESVETVFAEYFSPADATNMADVIEIKKVLELLKPDHLILLGILSFGEKSSKELKDEAVRRRLMRSLVFDSSTYAALIDVLVTNGLVELLPDHLNTDLNMDLRRLRLTTLGWQVVALERYITHKGTSGQGPLFRDLVFWMLYRIRG